MASAKRIQDIITSFSVRRYVLGLMRRHTEEELEAMLTIERVTSYLTDVDLRLNSIARLHLSHGAALYDDDDIETLGGMFGDDIVDAVVVLQRRLEGGVLEDDTQYHVRIIGSRNPLALTVLIAILIEKYESTVSDSFLSCVEPEAWSANSTLCQLKGQTMSVVDSMLRALGPNPVSPDRRIPRFSVRGMRVIRLLHSGCIDSPLA